MSQLPSGWCVAELSQLITLNPKTTADDALEAGFVPMPLLGTNFRSLTSYECRQWGEIKKGYTHFENDDVLLAKITPCFENGKAGIALNLPNGIGAGSTEYFVCRPHKDVICNRYLLAYFKTKEFLQAGESQMTGTVGHKRIPKEFLLGSRIPLAPLREQERIVQKLDVLLSQVDSCRERLERVPLILKRFRQSVLAAAMTGKLTEDWRETDSTVASAQSLANALKQAHIAAGGHKRGNAAAPTDGVHALMKSMFPAEWELVELRDLVSPDRPITYGILKPGPDQADGVPYVRVADYPKNCLQTTGLRRTSKAIDEEFSRSRLRAGDLLLSIRGTVGRVIEVPEELTGGNITQDSARLSLQPLVERQYVRFYLSCELAQSRMQLAVKGVAVRGINIGDVRALQIPLPPLEEQREIVRRVKGLLDLADSIERRCEVPLRAVSQLGGSILAKAFRGELVPQDPSDEPASELLKRIRTEDLDKSPKKAARKEKALAR